MRPPSALRPNPGIAGVGPAAKGEKVHIWLSQTEVKKLMACPAADVPGQRDKVVLGLLVGAGLRREEAVGLALDNVKLQPVRGKFRTPA